MWSPDAGQPPENLIHAIQDLRQILQTSSVILSQEGGAALDAELDAGQDPELWDVDEDEAEDMADFEEAHASGGPPVARKAATDNTPITPPPKNMLTAAPAAVEQGGAQSSRTQRFSARAMMNPKRHGTLGALAASMRAYPGTGKFLRFCIASLCIVAWVCSSTHPVRHWPACFDQTCGYPGEGPLTTLDSPDAPGMCLTPTQELRTCVVLRRKTQGDSAECANPPSHPNRMGTRARNAKRGLALRRVGELL